MGWIPTIEVGNEDGRKIRVNVVDELSFATKGYHRTMVEEPKEDDKDDNKETDGEKVIADDQAEVVPPEASVSGQLILGENISAEAADANMAAELAIE